MSTTLQIVISVFAGGFITWIESNMSTILSVVISVAAGGLISWLFFRKQNRRNRIAHFLTYTYDIGKGLTDIFPDFELNYKRENMSNIVYVLKGGFMNVGQSDIEGLEGQDDISMFLPEGCNVRDIKIFPSDEKLIVNEKHEGNMIKFGIEKFFAPDEFFRYVAIVESKEEIRNWGKYLEFDHRIKKTQKEIINYYIDLFDIDEDSKSVDVTFIPIIFIVMGLSSILYTLIDLIFPSKSDWFIIVCIATSILFVSITGLFSTINERRIRKVLRKSMKQK